MLCDVVVFSAVPVFTKVDGFFKDFKAIEEIFRENEGGCIGVLFKFVFRNKFFQFSSEFRIAVCFGRW